MQFVKFRRSHCQQMRVTSSNHLSHRISALNRSAGRLVSLNSKMRLMAEPRCGSFHRTFHSINSSPKLIPLTRSLSRKITPDPRTQCQFQTSQHNSPKLFTRNFTHIIDSARPMYDVIVVGGGHAGCEAAAAAARVGAKTLLVSQSLSNFGVMSCNPSFGGIGKGQLIKEIDALDGLMARMADKAGIHFRVLNESKGPAVRGPRCQADRQLYQAAMSAELKQIPNLTLQEGLVADLQIDWSGDIHNPGRPTITGLALDSGETIGARAVVLTTGTFLGANIHIGEEVRSCGRLGDPAANALSFSLHKAGLQLGRLRTGTPPRLLRATIDFSKFEEQPSEFPPEPMSMMNSRVTNEDKLVHCWIGRTTFESQQIVAENIKLKPNNLKANGGEGIGPRYCPSLETKVRRFPDRTHNIFLEPEGLTSDLIYPNGMTLSLPRHLQEQIVHSIPGLEKAKLSQYGYLVEYDYVDPRELHNTLETKKIKGLFHAGQINGSTGYEEAGGQGVVAGINAALSCNLESHSQLVLERSQGYIGVLIDDLVTRGADEPYRMFTSRAEFRLSLRADNADERLTELGHELGVVGETRYQAWREKEEQIEQAMVLLDSISMSSAEWEQMFQLHLSRPSPRSVSAADVLTHYHSQSPLVSFSEFAKVFPQLAVFSPQVGKIVDTNLRYKLLLQRQHRDIESYRKDTNIKLNPDIDYKVLSFLSIEEKEKLARTRPESLAQAARIPGISASSLLSLLQYSKKKKLTLINDQN